MNRSICYYLLVSVHRFKRQISDKQVWKNGGNPYFTRVFAVLNIHQDEDNRVLCWLEKSDGALRRAEVLSAGMTVVTLVFSEFTYTFDIQE